MLFASLAREQRHSAARLEVQRSVSLQLLSVYLLTYTYSVFILLVLQACSHIRSIVLVPGIGDEPVESWSKVRDTPLVHDLVEKGKPALNIYISILEHHLTTANLEQWEDLDSKAKYLLPRLEELLKSWNVSLVCPGDVALAERTCRHNQDLFYSYAIV